MKETSATGCQVLKTSLEATGRDAQTPTNSASCGSVEADGLCLPLTPDFSFNKPPFYRRLKAQRGTFPGECLQKNERDIIICV